MNGEAVKSFVVGAAGWVRDALPLIVCALALAGASAAGLSGCGAGDPGRQAVQPARSKPSSPLRLFAKPVPRFPVHGYTTHGMYPVAYVKGRPIASVNRRMRALIVRLMDSLAPGTRKAVRASVRGGGPGGSGGSFNFISLDERISASTREISLLKAFVECLPGGTECYDWFSATLRVPSGRLVRLPWLFSPAARRAALRTAERVVRKDVLSTSACARQSAHDPDNGAYYRRQLAPANWRGYRHFALTTRGLVIAFRPGDIGYDSCGMFLTPTVPYRLLEPYLSRLGRVMVDGVRRPVWSRP